MSMTEAEIANLRWTVRGKILEELHAREITISVDVVRAIDLMLDMTVSFMPTDRLNALNRAWTDWSWQELLAYVSHEASQYEAGRAVEEG